MGLDFFSSAEVDVSHHKGLRAILNEVEAYFSSATQLKIAEHEHVDIVFIPTLLKPGMFDSYREIKRVRRQKNQVEYRPRIDFDSYSAANESQRVTMILERVHEIADLIEELELPSESRSSVANFILQCSVSERSGF